MPLRSCGTPRYGKTDRWRLQQMPGTTSEIYVQLFLSNINDLCDCSLNLNLALIVSKLYNFMSNVMFFILTYRTIALLHRRRPVQTLSICAHACEFEPWVDWKHLTESCMKTRCFIGLTERWTSGELLYIILLFLVIIWLLLLFTVAYYVV